MAVDTADAPPQLSQASSLLDAGGFQAPQAFEVRAQHVKVPTIDLTVEPDDLWERMRRGFSMPDLNTDLVTDRQMCKSTPACPFPSTSSTTAPTSR